MLSQYDEWKCTNLDLEEAERIGTIQQTASETWIADRTTRKEIEQIIESLDMLNEEHKTTTEYHGETDVEGYGHEDIELALGCLKDIYGEADVA